VSNLDTGGTVRKFALVVLAPVPIIMILQTARLLWVYVSVPMPAHFGLIQVPSLVLLGALVVTMESVFGCVFIGVPIHLLLKKLRYSSPWTYVCVGVAIGIMLALIGYLRAQFSPKIDGVPVGHDEINPIVGTPIASFAFWWWFCDHGGLRRWRSEDVAGAIGELRFANPPDAMMPAEHIVSTAENAAPKTGDEVAGFFAAVFACAAFGVVESLVVCIISLILEAFSGTRDVMPIGMLISTLAILAYLVVIVSFIASLITSFAFFTVVGLPVHFLLVWRKARNLPAYLIAGLFANAAVTIGLMLVPSFRSAFFHLRMFTIPDFAVGGPLAQGVFWWVVRPDRRLQGPSP